MKGRLSVLGNPSILNLDDSVAVLRVLLVMRDLDDGRTLLVEPLEELHDLFALARMQVACRFVGENQLGIRDHRARNRDQLLLPSRKLIGIEILFTHHVETVERVTDDALALGFFDVPVRERDIEVFVNGQRIEQMVALEHEPDVLFVDLRSILLVQLMDRVFKEVVFACPGAVVHSKKMKQSGLPCPRRAHDGNKLAFLYVDVDAPQHVGFGWTVLEKLFDVAKRNHDGSDRSLIA